jgi:F-type H+-transporting ATPase subunit b
MDKFLHDLGVSFPLFWTQLIGFAILYVILSKTAFKPIAKILDDRQADIKATYDQLDRDREAMAKTRQEYEQRLAGIEAEARERIQNAVKEAQALRDNIVTDARKQAETIVEQGRTESDRERQKAFLEMRQQLVAITVAAAGKVIGETLDTQRHSKLVDDFIGNVGIGAIVESGRGVSGNTIGQGGTAA